MPSLPQLQSQIESEAVELLAELEHEQWIEWSKAVAHEVSPERRKRWEKLWIPYAELTEEQKDQDRAYARKILPTLHQATQRVAEETVRALHEISPGEDILEMTSDTGRSWLNHNSEES